MNKCYLVDTENVQNAWELLLEECGKSDKIILYITNQSPNLTIPSRVICSQNRYPEIRIFPCFRLNEKNALDFQLAAHLGYLIKEYPNMEFIIISNDHGYNPIPKFFEREQVSVKVQKIKTLTCGRIEKTSKELDPIEEYEELTGGFPEEESKAIRKISEELKQLRTSKNKTLCRFYYHLVQTYGEEKGAGMYRILKPRIKRQFSL